MSTEAATPDLDVEEQLEEQTSFYKQYVLIIYNDDDHTFDYVIESLAKVFKYEVQKCVELAIRIHTEGRALVFSGMYEHVELKQDQIKSCGPDMYNHFKKVTYPLLTEIQPI